MPDFNPNKCRAIYILDICVLLVQTGLFGIYTFSILLAVIYPQSLIFIGGLVPPKFFIFPIRLLITMYHTYVYAAVCSGVAVEMAFISAYWFYLYMFISRELRLTRNMYWSDSSLRRLDDIRIVYRAFECLHSRVLNDCCIGSYMAWLNAYLELVSIFLSFVLLRYWNVLALISKVPLVLGFVLVPVGWTLFLELGGRLQKASLKMVSSWRNCNWGNGMDNKLMQKFCRSCLPILMCWGKWFVVGRKSVLTFQKGVTRGTVRVLLMSRKMNK